MLCFPRMNPMFILVTNISLISGMYMLQRVKEHYAVICIKYSMLLTGSRKERGDEAGGETQRTHKELGASSGGTEEAASRVAGI